MSRFTRTTSKNLLVVVMVGATIYMLIDIMKDDESEENPILKRKEWRKEEFQHPGEISEKERREFRQKIEKMDKMKAEENAPPQDNLFQQLFKGIPGGTGELLNMDSDAMGKYRANLKELQESNEILKMFANRRNEIMAKNEEKRKMMEKLLGIESGYNALNQQQNGGVGPQPVEQGQLQFNPPPNGYNDANANLGIQNPIIDPNQELHSDKYAQLQQLLNGINQGNVGNPNVPPNEFKVQPMGPGEQPQQNQMELLKRLMEMQNRGNGNSPNNELGNLPPYPGNNIPNYPNEYQNNPVNVNNLPPYPGNDHPFMGHVSPNNGDPFNMGNSPSSNFPNMDSLPYNPQVDPHMTRETPQDISSETNPPANDERETPPSDNGEESYNTEGDPQVETEGYNPETRESHPYLENTEVEPQVQTEGNDPKTKEIPPYLENSEGVPHEEWAPDSHPSEVPVNREYEEPQH